MPGWDSLVNAVLSTLEKYIGPVRGSASIKALDIGCSFGGLVHALRLKEVEAYGVDLNPLPIEEGRDYGNKYIYSMTAADFIEQIGVTPDVFVSNHTLEHFIDPFSFIADLWKHFGANTIGCFAFPNGNHYCSLIGNYTDYGFYAFPDHLHLF